MEIERYVNQSDNQITSTSLERQNRYLYRRNIYTFGNTNSSNIIVPSLKYLYLYSLVIKLFK